MPIKKNKISYTLDLEKELVDVKPSNRKQASEAVGLLLLSGIESEVSSSRSPVENGEFKKKLSKDYAKKKGSSKADLQLTGNMLGNLDIKATRSKVTIKIKDSKEKKKAFNHNTGDTLPVRKFLPDDEKNEKFKKKITNRIKDVVRDFE